MSIRVCKECKVAQPLQEYHKCSANKGGRKPVCRTCNNLKTREARRLKGRTETPEQRRKWSLKAKYGISLEDYTELMVLQNGKCKICNAGSDKGQAGFLVVDHNHATGKVRGLLCNHCNAALGMFKDSTTLLNEAIKYINKDAGF